MSKAPEPLTKEDAEAIERYLTRFYVVVSEMPEVMRRFNSDRIDEQIFDLEQRMRISRLISWIEEKVA
jgi:hypothetical protein